MSDPRIRTLKIRTGVVKRLAKEKQSYEKEASQQKERIARLIAEGKGDYEVKKQEEVLQESLMMVPDCQRKLLPAIQELQKLLDDETDLAETEEYQQAVKVMEDAKPHVAI